MTDYHMQLFHKHELAQRIIDRHNFELHVIIDQWREWITTTLENTHSMLNADEQDQFEDAFYKPQADTQQEFAIKKKRQGLVIQRILAKVTFITFKEMLKISNIGEHEAIAASKIVQSETLCHNRLTARIERMDDNLAKSEPPRRRRK